MAEASDSEPMAAAFASVIEYDGPARQRHRVMVEADVRTIAVEPGPPGFPCVCVRARLTVEPEDAGDGEIMLFLKPRAARDLARRIELLASTLGDPNDG